MAPDLLLCAVGFVLLYFGAEWLVKGSSNIARSLGVRPLVIGLTVVAFGTSAPELVVSVISSVKAKSMIAVGNVFGSNICNIALVLGMAAALRPIRCDRSVVTRDIPIMLAVTVFTIALCLDDTLGRAEGAILIVGILAYTLMNYRLSRRGTVEGIVIPDDGVESGLVGRREAMLVVGSCALIAVVAFAIGDLATGVAAVGMLVVGAAVFDLQSFLRAGSRLLLLAFVIAGIYGVVLGAKIVVDSAERIMVAFGVDEKFIGLTVVAFGTSLPELATSVVAALRKEMDISIGNLVGSNVFNLLSVLGVASLVRPIPIPGGFIHSGMAIDGVVMLIISALPWFMLRRDATVGRKEGGVLLLCYVGFLVFLVVRG